MSNIKNIFKKLTLVSVASAAMFFSTNALAYRDLSDQLDLINRQVVWQEEYVTYCYSHGMDCYTSNNPGAEEQAAIDELARLKAWWWEVYELQYALD